MSIRRIVPILFTLIFVTGCTPPPDNGLKPFQGTWAFAQFSDNGKSLGEAELKKLELVVSNDLMQMLNDGNVVDQFTITVRPGLSPKEIDMVHLEGEKQGKADLGIFSMEGTDLKICVAYQGKPRPNTLAPAKGEIQFYVLRKK